MERFQAVLNMSWDFSLEPTKMSRVLNKTISYVFRDYWFRTPYFRGKGRTFIGCDQLMGTLR